MMITFNGIVFQEIGIPSPPGMIPAIPKYTVCRGSAWKRGSIDMCRVIREYTPEAVIKASMSSGYKPVYDPVYGSTIPYVRIEDVILYKTPIQAYIDVVSKPRGRLSNILLETSIMVKGEWSIGLTGTLAISMENDDISDIDLIIETYEPSKFMNKFTRIVEPYMKNPRLSWRRGYFKGIHISWTAAPREKASHCPPLKNYWSIKTPKKWVDTRVRIRPMQEEALLYPPCVESDIGYIVSYEYNNGLLLYQGGLVRIRGLLGDGVLYMGVKRPSRRQAP